MVEIGRFIERGPKDSADLERHYSNLTATFAAKKVGRGGGLSSGADGTGESEPVPEGIRYSEVTRVPRCVLDLWSSIGVVSRAQFVAERIHILDFDAHRRARRRVAMVLGQMQVAVTSADAHVERGALVEPVFEHHVEPKKGHVKLACLNFIKAAQDGGSAT